MNTEFTQAFFDEASKAWMENKVRKGPTMAYICEALLKKDSKPCLKPCPNILFLNSKHLCTRHKHWKPPTGANA